MKSPQDGLPGREMLESWDCPLSIGWATARLHSHLVGDGVPAFHKTSSRTNNNSCYSRH